MKKLLITLAVSGCVAWPLPSSATGIPVVDVVANGLAVKALAQDLKTYAEVMQQVYYLTKLADLSTLASTVLGDSMNPELAELFDSGQAAFNNTQKAYGGVMGAPTHIDNQLALFREPAGGWASLTPQQMISRLNRMNDLTKGTSSASVATAAESLERKIEREKAMTKATGMADRSVSDLSATQALAQQLRVLQATMEAAEDANQRIATQLAMKEENERAEREIRDAISDNDRNARAATIAYGPVEPSTSVLNWGN